MTSPAEPWRNASLINAADGEVIRPEHDHPLPWGADETGLVFLLADTSARSISLFLNLLAAHTPVALFDPAMDASAFATLLAAYRPSAVLYPPDSDLAEVLTVLPGRFVGQGAWLSDAPAVEVDPDLAVLLSTSGSTGNPKTVRLSRANVLSNARSIVDSLSLDEDDTAITSLPFHFSFGMSVITSHTLAGAPIVVTSSSVIEPTFWESVEKYRVTFLAGVPQTYEMLRRLRVEDRLPTTLRAMIQAGGRLKPEIISHFHAVMTQRGGNFHVMYGQTEAAPRMSCLPAVDLPERLGSVGLPMSGGHFKIHDQDGNVLPAGDVGEVVYGGPNVMMGYAESSEDLRRGDEAGGVLRTGDLGYLDADGYLFLTGRIKRIAKVAGVRISLDDVEAIAGYLGSVAAVPRGDDGIAIFRVADSQIDPADRRHLAAELKIHPKFVRIIDLTDLPMLPSGKIDYRRLTTMAEEGL